MPSNVFQIATPPSCSFCLIIAIRKKSCGTDFRNFDFKIFGEFLKFYMRTVFAAATTAAELSIGLIFSFSARRRDASIKRGLYTVMRCLCVRLSRSVKTNKHVLTIFHNRVAKPFYFFRTKRHGNIPTGPPPPNGASNAGGVGRNRYSEPILYRFTA